MKSLLLIFILFFQYSQAQTNVKKTFDELIAENKGKVILIDYWASWCKPCRKEMPAMKKLMESYKDADVAFVFISMDIEAEKWQSASKKEGLADITHNYMTNDIIKTELSRSLKISAIPRYVIFDRNGNLVNADAPHPRDKEMKEELDKYLNK